MTDESKLPDSLEGYRSDLRTKRLTRHSLSKRDEDLELGFPVFVVRIRLGRKGTE